MVAVWAEWITKSWRTATGQRSALTLANAGGIEGEAGAIRPRFFYSKNM
jgi:hypothetical protein